MTSATAQTAPPIHVVDLITTDDDKTFAPAGRMAVAIIAITGERGGCLPQDLNEKGFSPADIAAHWHLAQSLAAVELNLMRERPAKPNSLFRRK